MEVSCHTRCAAFMTLLSCLGFSLGSRDNPCYVPSMLHTLPALLAKVRLSKKGDVFLVVDVDYDKETLELIAMNEWQHLIQDVQLGAIHELVEGPPIYL
jgi:hypothetical protein